MSEIHYKVVDECGTVLITGATIDNALIFMKAYFEKYYRDTGTKLTIEFDDATKKLWNDIDNRA